MLGFLKKIFGFPTQEEVSAAKAESLVVNNKTGEIVQMPVVTAEPAVVNNQITDAVTQSQPVEKKARKPRAPKAEKVVKEKVAKPVKVASKKVAAKRSKKA